MSTGETPAVARARVKTARPERYGKQLASHLGRRHGGDWDSGSGTGWIDFGDGKAALIAEDGVLEIEVSSSNDLDRLLDVVAQHLIRFGGEENLFVEWT